MDHGHMASVDHVSLWPCSPPSLLFAPGGGPPHCLGTAHSYLYLWCLDFYTVSFLVSFLSGHPCFNIANVSNALW